jgi:hypothetical protein
MPNLPFVKLESTATSEPKTEAEKEDSPFNKLHPPKNYPAGALN